MQEKDVTIIMPVYNNAKTLERALDSVLKQKFSGTYELFCVIDPSNDSSYGILKDYEMKNPDIVKVFAPKERLGQALSREKYISNANGKFIAFMDGDDELREDYISKMYEAIEKYDADIVSSSFYAVYGKNNKKIIYPFRRRAVLKGIHIMNSYFMDACLRGFMWCKMYRKELLLGKPRIVLNQFGDMFEDQALNASLLSKCKKVVLLSDPLYYYYKNNATSATGAKRTDRALKHLNIFALERRFFEITTNKNALKAFKKHLYRTRWSWKFDLKLDLKNGATAEYKKKVLETWKSIKNFNGELNIKGESYEELLSRGIIF